MNFFNRAKTFRRVIEKTKFNIRLRLRDARSQVVLKECRLLDDPQDAVRCYFWKKFLRRLMFLNTKIEPCTLTEYQSSVSDGT